MSGHHSFGRGGKSKRQIRATSLRADGYTLRSFPDLVGKFTYSGLDHIGYCSDSDNYEVRSKENTYLEYPLYFLRSFTRMIYADDVYIERKIKEKLKEYLDSNLTKIVLDYLSLEYVIYSTVKSRESRDTQTRQINHPEVNENYCGRCRIVEISLNNYNLIYRKLKENKVITSKDDVDLESVNFRDGCTAGGSGYCNGEIKYECIELRIADKEIEVKEDPHYEERNKIEQRRYNTLDDEPYKEWVDAADIGYMNSNPETRKRAIYYSRGRNLYHRGRGRGRGGY